MYVVENGCVTVPQTHRGFSSVLMCYEAIQNKVRHQADLYVMLVPVLL